MLTYNLASSRLWDLSQPFMHDEIIVYVVIVKAANVTTYLELVCYRLLITYLKQ